MYRRCECALRSVHQTPHDEKVRYNMIPNTTVGSNNQVFEILCEKHICVGIYSLIRGINLLYVNSIV